MLPGVTAGYRESRLDSIEFLIVVHENVKQEREVFVKALVTVGITGLEVGYVAIVILNGEAALPSIGREGTVEVGTLTVAVVITEVEVGAELAEERHLEVELDVADALVNVRLRAIVVDERTGVDSLKCVDVSTGSCGTRDVTRVGIGCPVVEHVAFGILHRKRGVE